VSAIAFRGSGKSIADGAAHIDELKELATKYGTLLGITLDKLQESSADTSLLRSVCMVNHLSLAHFLKVNLKLNLCNLQLKLLKPKIKPGRLHEQRLHEQIIEPERGISMCEIV
jgi:hypothetical protein